MRDRLAHCHRDQRGLVSAALREVCNAQDAADACDRAGHVLERLAPVAPRVCALLEAAEEDLTGFICSHASTDQAAVHQPAGTLQQRDRPAI